MSCNRNSPTAEQIEQFRQAKREGKTYPQIASESGFSTSTVKRSVHGNRNSSSKEPVTIGASVEPQQPSESAAEREYAEFGDKANLKFRTSKPIRTLKELEASCEVDLALWRVAKWGCRAWTVPMKTGNKEEGFTPKRIQSYSVWVDFERLAPKAIQDANEAIFERMKEYAPKYVGLPRLSRCGSESHLAVLSLTDVHWGKLAWKLETGNSQDLKIIESIYTNAIDDLIVESKHRPIDRWLFVVGSDFFHIDNSKNTTFNNTPQDVDGRYAKIIETGEMAVIGAVEKLMQFAPVDIKYCAGNHDQTASFHLARTLNAWFRNTDRVNVDYGPTFRKYYHWKKTLLGMTHGNEEKIASLPTIMAQERPKEWAESTCREWLVGHMHRSRQWMTMPTETVDATTIRVMRSLIASDGWHTKRGFLQSPTSRCAELWWYNKNGYAGHSVVNARES